MICNECGARRGGDLYSGDPCGICSTGILFAINTPEAKAVALTRRDLSAKKRRRISKIGDILHRKIVALGYGEYEGCRCRSIVGKMNCWGPDGCRKHLDEIVQEVLRSAAQYRKAERVVLSVPIVSVAAKFAIRLLVLSAIREAEKIDAQNNPPMWSVEDGEKVDAVVGGTNS